MRFSERKTNDNNDKRLCLRVKECDKWSVPGLGCGTDYVSNLHNYMAEGMRSYTSLFADYAKIMKVINKENGC